MFTHSEDSPLKVCSATATLKEEGKKAILSSKNYNINKNWAEGFHNYGN